MLLSSAKNYSRNNILLTYLVQSSLSLTCNYRIIFGKTKDLLMHRSLEPVTRFQFLKIFALTSVFILVSLFAFNQTPAKKNTREGVATFSADSLAKYIAVLSSDEFEGRKPFT